jgi:hypothetical protein
VRKIKRESVGAGLCLRTCSMHAETGLYPRVLGKEGVGEGGVVSVRVPCTSVPQRLSS